MKCMTFLLSLQVNPKHPDFKHKVGGYSLWLTDAPGWILSELEGVEYDFQTPKSKLVKQHKGKHGQSCIFNCPHLYPPCLCGTPPPLSSFSWKIPHPTHPTWEIPTLSAPYPSLINPSLLIIYINCYQQVTGKRRDVVLI